MKIKLLISVFFAVAMITSSAELKILSWNVENLFDTIDDPKKDDTVLSQDEYINKITLISSLLKKLNPDIIAFCEIENIAVLNDIKTKSGYNFAYLIEGNDPRGIDVGIMSKHEITYKSNKDIPTPYPGNLRYKFSRDCTESKLSIDGVTIHILLTHLKSRYKEAKNDESKRNAQVKGMLDIIADIYNKSPDKDPLIIVTGDMNSPRFTEPLNILEKAGLKILNYDYPQDKFYTYIYRKQKQDLDYFLLNKPAMSKFKKRELRFINEKIFKSVSDHNPLELTLEF